MRLVTLMTLLAAVDMTFVVICAMKVMETGPSVFILFGFEVRAVTFYRSLLCPPNTNASLCMYV